MGSGHTGYSPWRTVVVVIVFILSIDLLLAGISYLDHRGDPPRLPPFFSSGVRPLSPGLDAYHPLDPGFGYSTAPSDPVHASSTGRVRITVDARTYIDPDASAAYAIAALDQLAETGNRAWLRRAETAVEDVLRSSVDNGMFPHRFPGEDAYGVPVEPPWFSPQAQGLMLSVLVRLHELTGEQRWRGAADSVYDTFLRFRDAPAGDGIFHRTWLSDVDDRGYLWFVKDPGSGRDGWVISAHLTGLIGIYDYLAIGDLSEPRREGALRLFDGGRRPSGTTCPSFADQAASFGVPSAWTPTTSPLTTG